MHELLTKQKIFSFIGVGLQMEFEYRVSIAVIDRCMQYIWTGHENFGSAKVGLLSPLQRFEHHHSQKTGSRHSRSCKALRCKTTCPSLKVQRLRSLHLSVRKIDGKIKYLSKNWDIEVKQYNSQQKMSEAWDWIEVSRNSKESSMKDQTDREIRILIIFGVQECRKGRSKKRGERDHGALHRNLNRKLLRLWRLNGSGKVTLVFQVWTVPYGTDRSQLRFSWGKQKMYNMASVFVSIFRVTSVKNKISGQPVIKSLRLNNSV